MQMTQQEEASRQSLAACNADLAKARAQHEATQADLALQSCIRMYQAVCRVDVGVCNGGQRVAGATTWQSPLTGSFCLR